jgi:hypothetical protein
MSLENQPQPTRQLLGHFLIVGAYSSALIVDWGYLKDTLYYDSGDDEHPQITIPVDAEWNPDVPKFTELGYIPVGVCPSIDLSEAADQLTGKPYTNIDIPVYAIGHGEAHTGLLIDVAAWIPSEEVSLAAYNFKLEQEDELGVAYTLYPPGLPEVWELSPDQPVLRRQFFGYVTALGGGIVVCDSDLIWLVDDQHDGCTFNQIICSAEADDAPGGRIGVMAYLPAEFQDKEFPVYGEYDGENLQHIIVEITDADHPVNLLPGNHPYVIRAFFS